LVSPTAGTTGGGMIDPLEACARIAREHDAWLHVDASWGGAALCSPRMAPLLAGIELADSMTIDAHKWLATTMGCGMFIARDPGVLSEAFRVTTDLSSSSASNLDPCLNTMQWSRRFIGLCLFLSLATAGWQGYAAHVERAAELIAQVRRRLLTCGWSAANESQLAVLCAVPPADSAPIREIVRKVLASGRAWVAATRFEGREVVRICATHGESSRADVDMLIEALEAARRAGDLQHELFH
jgi:glutamate/tyrosine decarboxylase-like PLP-dependent enzyme